MNMYILIIISKLCSRIDEFILLGNTYEESLKYLYFLNCHLTLNCKYKNKYDNYNILYTISDEYTNTEIIKYYDEDINKFNDFAILKNNKIIPYKIFKKLICEYMKKHENSGCGIIFIKKIETYYNSNDKLAQQNIKTTKNIINLKIKIDLKENNIYLPNELINLIYKFWDIFS